VASRPSYLHRELFGAVTSSEQAGSCKPDPAIYRMALRTAGIEPSRGLFVGDSLRHDVQGPAAVGIQTAWMAPSATADPGDIRPDAVIHELADVLSIVGVGVGR
jgi:FMN phosphatase YigB (HAD superfamily)